MLIDKPRCNFKNCRYCFDSNCTSADKYENCKLTDLGHEIAKLTVDLDNAKSEVAREIFDELDGRLDKICIVANKETEYRGFIGVVQQVFDAVGVVLADLKKKYTEEQT